MSAPNAQPAKRGSMKSPVQRSADAAGQPSATLDNSTKLGPGSTKGINPGKVGGRRGNGNLK